ncbi:MAG: hypothetical protein U0Z26_01575 [Anaerolineales bacterium]
MRVLTIAIAIASGVLVLLGYFFPEFMGLGSIQPFLLNTALLMAAAAALVGVWNLTVVHADKIRRREKGGVYSAFLIAFLVMTIAAGLIPPGYVLLRVGAENVIPSEILFKGIIFPVEASLMGILTISLLYAAIRLLRRRTDLMSIVFIVVAVLIMLGSATLPIAFGGNIPVLSSLSQGIKNVLAVGGARGILIGVALGTLTTGLRALIGADRPYGGK